MKAIHLKTGNEYIVYDQFVINATNANNGQRMVLYGKKKENSDEIQLYVRENIEFFQKFRIEDHGE